MSRLIVVLLMLRMIAASSVSAAAAEPAHAPLNVLFIAVDDLTARLGCYGSGAVATPNIDKLAGRGMLFDRAYCQFPLCSPSRTSLLSGLRPETTKILDSDTPPRTHIGNVRFLPEYFHDHGYFTARISKIAHGKFEEAVSWDVAESPKGNAKGTIPERKDGDSKEESRLQWEATDHDDTEEVDGDAVRRGAQWIRESRDRPFFIVVGFRRPHLPFVAPRRYFDQYPLAGVTLPKTPPDDRDDVPSAAFPLYSGDQRLTPTEQREVIRAYQACITFVDAQVGSTPSMRLA